MDLARPGHCWNGIMYLDFVDIVERKQSLWKLGGENNVQMSHAEREYIHELIRFATVLSGDYSLEVSVLLISLVM